MGRKKKKPSAGFRLIDFIHKAKLFTVECPGAPDLPCLIVWSANADDQLDAFVRDEIQAAAKAAD